MATTILLVNAAVAYVTLRFKRAALRPHGVVSVRDLRYAFLEEDGHVSVISRRPTDE